MNEEQNPATNDSETSGTTDNGSVTTGRDSQSPDASTGDNAGVQDDYYAVDHAKKDVLSTIGDGEMHDEGLVGGGDITPDISSSAGQSSDEQDEAETYDSEQ